MHSLIMRSKVRGRLGGSNISREIMSLIDTRYLYTLWQDCQALPSPPVQKRLGLANDADRHVAAILSYSFKMAVSILDSGFSHHSSSGIRCSDFSIVYLVYICPEPVNSE